MIDRSGTPSAFRTALAYTFPCQDGDNTRVKDLVDLVLLVHSGLLEAA